MNKKTLMLIAISAFAAIVFAVLWFGWERSKPLTLKNRLAAEWQSLDATDRALAGRTALSAWSGGVFLGSQTMATILNTVVGSKVEYIPEKGWLTGTTVTVNSLEFKPMLGHAIAQVGLVARKGDLEIGLDLLGSLSYLGAARTASSDGDPRVLVTFRIDPLELKPSARFGPLQVSLNEFWNALLPDLAVAFSDPKVFNVPVVLQDTFKLKLSLDESSKDVVNKKTGATISYTTKLTGATLEERISYAAPVFRPEGIWLLARRSEGGQDEVLPRPAPTETELPGLVETLRARVANQTSTLTGDARTASVWVSSSVLTSLVNRLGEIPDQDRKVTIQTTDRSGRLAEDKWRDDLLGEGGVYAELAGPAGASATLQLGKPNVTWGPTNVRFTMPATAKMKASMHFHFDPLIGGGVGTTIGMEGEGGGAIEATAEPIVLSDPSGLRVAALDTRLACGNLEAVTTTDGVLKIDLGWIKVPKVGAKVKLPLGRSQFGALKLWDNGPVFVPTPSVDPRVDEEDLGKRQALIKKNSWAFIPKSGGIKAKIVPESIVMDASGMRATVSFALETLALGFSKDDQASARKVIAAEANEIAKRSADLLSERRPAKECNGEIEVEVLLGPIEIGSQNEIVKFARNAWSDLTKGPGPNNDLRKAVEAAGGAAKQAANQVVDFVRRTFGIKW